MPNRMQSPMDFVFLSMLIGFLCKSSVLTLFYVEFSKCKMWVWRFGPTGLAIFMKETPMHVKLTGWAKKGSATSFEGPLFLLISFYLFKTSQPIFMIFAQLNSVLF